MKKPTITYLIFNTKNNGGNKVIFEHVNRLYQRGYEMRLFSFFGGQPNWFPLEIKVAHIFSFFVLSTSDILVASFWPTAYLVYFLKAKKKFHFVQAWEEDFYSNFLLRKLAKLATTLPLPKITISQFLESKLKVYTPPNLSIKRLPEYAIDFSVFRPRAFIPDTKIIRILSVISWYQWYKGTDLLEKAIKKLKSSHPNYKFILVSFEQKPYSPVFDNFFSNPAPSQLVKLYQTSQILLVTSRSEGFLLPGLEAMACGCIVVTTNSGGIMEYAKHNCNAFVLKHIKQLWEEDIIEKLVNNKTLLNRFIANGYKTAKQYQWSRILKKLEKIYSE